MSESEHPGPYIDAPPQEILSYIHEMLKALSQLAARQGDFDLAQAIQEATDRHPMEAPPTNPPH